MKTTTTKCYNMLTKGNETGNRKFQNKHGDVFYFCIYISETIKKLKKNNVHLQHF